MKRIIAGLLLILTLLVPALAGAKVLTVYTAEHAVEQNGWYDTMEEVAVYLTQYGKLPGNYITKRAAQNLGWESRLGNLWKVADGCAIGGDRFGNYEGQLPDAKGRRWTECDIEFDGGFRNGKRVVFSNDGLIYYTGDHYNSFDEVQVVEGENPALKTEKDEQTEKSKQTTNKSNKNNKNKKSKK